MLIPGLQFLVRLANDMGLPEGQEYANKLKKVEKLNELKEQQVNMLIFALILLF